VGRSPYQSEKRRKELARLKKQEEKRQRRFNKKHEGEGTEGQTGDEASPEGTAPESPVEGEAQQDTSQPDQDANKPS
jgi:hypothetical protein